MERFGQPSASYAWRLWPFLKSLTCDATGRQSIEHQTSGRCLLRRGKTPSIDCQATCRKQLRSSACKQTAEADKIVRASYDVSRILARWMKPFSDGDFIKECHVTVVDSVCPEQRSVFETVSLSSRTVRRRIEEMSQLACVPNDVEPGTCVSVVASMREEFASRFAGIKPLAADFKLFTAHFDFPVDDASPPPCIWSWWSYIAMMNWRQSSTTLRHCPSSATSPSLLGIFLHSLRMFNAS